MKKRRLSAVNIISISFILVIILGGVLLSLPIASASGESTPFITSLFTATSACCVTGLIIVDTAVHFNLFGQIVILLLIQAGGLGIMTLFSVISYALSSKLSLQSRKLLIESASVSDSSINIRTTLKYIVGGTFLIEFIGAITLMFSFIPEYGIGKGIYKSIFIAISAFCNAGFDVFGVEKGAYTSLASYSSSPGVLIPIMLLIILGGLGFIVWQDIVSSKSIKKLKIHSKIVIIATLILIFSGALFFFLFEYSNEATIGSYGVFDKIVLSFTQSVTSRTAGFAAYDMSAMKDGSSLITMILMLIGCAPGSTGGGIKITVIVVLVLSVFATFKNRTDINVFKRRINISSALKAISITSLYIFITIVATLTLMCIEDLPLRETMFEVISAIATVGLTMGITPSLSAVSHVILIVLMFFGRIGVLTFTLSILGRSSSSSESIRYPEGKIFM